LFIYFFQCKIIYLCAKKEEKSENIQMCKQISRA
jgi:hypothetical protein